MSIRAIFRAVFLFFGLLIVGCTGLQIFHSWNSYHQAEQALKLNALSDHFVAAATAWAQERGLSNSALNQPEPATSEQIHEIETARQSGNISWQAAMSDIRMLKLRVPDKVMADYTASQRELASLREAMSTNLVLPKDERQATLMKSWFATSSRHIEAGQSVRLVLAAQAAQLGGSMGRNLALQHNLWLMSEYAGRERGAVAGIISAGEPITTAQLEKIAGYRANIEQGWQFVTDITAADTKEGAFSVAYDAAAKTYFGKFTALRLSVMQAANTDGNYPVSAKDWFAEATKAIGTLKAMGDANREAMNSDLNQKMASERLSLIVSLSACLFGIAGFFGAGWLLNNRISLPLAHMVEIVKKMASGHFEAEVPYTGRPCEIGRLAGGLQQFRQCLIENRQLQQEAEGNRTRVAEERKIALQAMANRFEDTVLKIVNSVAAASTQLESSAHQLSRAAKKTSGETGAVTGAAESSAQNTQALAAAAEEMGASIREIASQVHHSAQVTKNAESFATRTTETVSQLSHSATRIGDVVALIQNIAAQTNLLALNATIEAARAGEAGRGFAVVATEVKGLATQTARATEEILGQVSAVQAATRDAVDAMQEIVSTINEISSISTSISAAVEEQTATVEEISRSTAEVAALSESVAQRMISVQDEVKETDTAAGDSLLAARSLGEASVSLNQVVDDFLSTVRAA